MQSCPSEPLPTAECAVPAEFSAFIGGVMQYLWRRDSKSDTDFLLRIQEGERSGVLLALARAAGIRAVVSDKPGNAEAPPAPFLWDAISKLDTIVRLKESLHRPARVYELLRELAAAHPAEANLLSVLHERAVRLLQLDGLIDGPRKWHRLKAAEGAAAEPENRVVVAAATSGLANRMLLIAGCRRIGELTGRRLVVHWPNNNQLGCSFEHLFTNPFDMLVGDELESLLRTDRTLKVYNAWKTAAPLYTDICEDGDPEADILLIKGWIYPKFPHEYYDPEFYRRNREHLRIFQPQPRIAARAMDFALPPDCLGIHIRRGDAMSEFKTSANEHFERIMRALLAARPSTHFFLATDDAATETIFQTAFGRRLVVFPKQGGDRTTPEGMEEALIDLLLLSRSQAVLGNYFSTFSHAAASLSDIPLVVADAHSCGEGLEESLRILLRH